MSDETEMALSAPESGARQRIARLMARSGVCSRREAERWIAQGRVQVNGQVLTTPAVTVGAEDRVLVDGEPLKPPEAPRLWSYYKPVGLVVSENDPDGRPTVIDALPDHMPRVVTVGRLDINSEGLLLLTNDGRLSRHLELPDTGAARTYRVRVYGRVTPAELSLMAAGITVDDMRYAPIEAKIDSQEGTNAWLTMVLHEGKNREIRRICEHFGWQVNRLIRTGYGAWTLGSLKPGEVREISSRRLAMEVGRLLGEAARDLSDTGRTDMNRAGDSDGADGRRGRRADHRRST
ncbi:MAG: pseudouridine synthase [Alphaproteobacteria bacterium]